VKEKDIRRHKMHREYYRLDAAAAQEINAARRRGGRIVAVGTTSCRVLEAAADETGFVKEREDWTDLFIYPGYAFKAVDALLTNFHLPRSTLLMLVCAFAGYNQVMEAYRIAVNEIYRFYSFGDCMLLL
jgi:S-adenosylmethionine:tRNA ribosyltransferase-isomerase